MDAVKLKVVSAISENEDLHPVTSVPLIAFISHHWYFMTWTNLASSLTWGMRRGAATAQTCIHAVITKRTFIYHVSFSSLGRRDKNTISSVSV